MSLPFSCNLPTFLCQRFSSLLLSVSMHRFMAVMAQADQVSFSLSSECVPDIKSFVWMLLNIVHMMDCCCLCIDSSLLAQLTFSFVKLQDFFPYMLPSRSCIEAMYVLTHTTFYIIDFSFCHHLLPFFVRVLQKRLQHLDSKLS